MEKSDTIIVLKFGGVAARDILTILFADIAGLTEKWQWVLLHGGGAQASSISRQYGIEPHFIDGIRQTSREEMDTIDMGLAGLVNTAVLRQAMVAGLKTVGLSGVDAGLFLAEKTAADNHTGKIISVNTNILYHLLEGGYLPVISSVSSTIEGEGININADDAALTLASALNARKLIFISDVAGVLGMENARGGREIVSQLNGLEAEEMIQTGLICGGMIPKVRNSLLSLQEGTGEVHIANIDRKGDLHRIINRQRGTSIVR